jgi:SAC3 family protein LENG8/THP3
MFFYVSSSSFDHHDRYLRLSLTVLQKELAFESPTQARDFLSTHSAAFFTNPNSADSEKTLDCKATISPLTQIYEEKYRKVLIKGAI